VTQLGDEFERKTFTLPSGVVGKLTLRAAQDVADKKRKPKKAESEIVAEALTKYLKEGDHEQG
jgi:hypothetical protein